MVSAILSRSLILVFGALLPAYQSYKAIKSKNLREYVKWMMYWIVFALFTTMETFADLFISWVPFYYEAKVLFLFWLLSPVTKGSSILYRKYIHPRLVKHEKAIDKYLKNAQRNSCAAIADVGKIGFNVASETIVKTLNNNIDILDMAADPEVIVINEEEEKHQDANGTSSRKRLREDERSRTDNKSSKRSYGLEPLVKVLVPNDAAGAIIGKRGSNLGELKKRYGATIRISHTTDVYPGTDERIVVLTGEVDQIIDLHNYIIDKVATARVMERSREDNRGHQVKIIVTQNVAGLVIGKGGSIIKALKEETGAYIDLTGLDQSPVQGERILTIKGTPEQRIEASRQIIIKIASDSGNMANTGLKYPSRSRDEDNYRNERDRHQKDGPFDSHRGRHQSNHGAAGVGNSFGNLEEVVQQLVGLAGQSQQLTTGVFDNINTKVQIQMEIPELLVGPLMGIHGSILQEFVQFSGAKIEFSRSELGMSHRTLTMLGDLNQTQIAYHLVNQKITQIRGELVASKCL